MKKTLLFVYAIGILIGLQGCGSFNGTVQGTYSSDGQQACAPALQQFYCPPGYQTSTGPYQTATGGDGSVWNNGWNGSGSGNSNVGQGQNNSFQNNNQQQPQPAQQGQPRTNPSSNSPRRK